MKVIHVSGRRKQAIARATLRPGAGIVRINSKLLNTVSPKIYQMRIQEPIAIARALVALNNDLQKEFLEYDRTLLIADIRMKETHKPNCHGKARAKRQKSYR